MNESGNSLPDLGHEELLLLLHLGERLVAELDMENVLALVAETACQVVQAETLVVPMIDPGGQAFTYRAAHGEYAAMILGQTFPLHEGACGWVIHHQRPLLFGEGGSFDLDASARWQPGMASSLLVPLISRGVITGGLSAMGKRGGGAFNLRDLTVLTLFANQASIAIDNARLFKKLGEEESRLRLVLDSAGEAIYGIDKGGICTFANPACVRMLGYASEAELIGKNMPSTLHHCRTVGSHLPETECRIDLPFDKGGEIRVDGEVHWHRSGKPFPVELWTRAMLRDGELIGTVVTFTDITERRRMEEELRLLNENLEQRVREETAKNMAQERMLIQQSRLAAMGEMIHNIAHQWRQPINALTLLLANIKDAYEFNDLTKEYLDGEVKTGQDLIQGMSTTIDDFRNFFRPNKEKILFLTGDAVEAAIKFVSDSFTVRNIRILQEKNDEPCVVSGFPNEFAQVVLNALTNAKEAMVGKKIGGEIHIEIKPDKHEAIVTIRDNGGGIPEEILPKIFDPYFTTKESGSGIGLYMSKMIMSAMGGSIVVRNVGDGAEVRLSLPIAK